MTTRTAPKLSVSDPTLEPLKTLLAKLPGGKPSPQTIWRWLHKGRHGVRLPALSICGAWHSTPEALEWFVESVTASDFAAVAERNSDVTAEELAEVGM